MPQLALSIRIGNLRVRRVTEQLLPIACMLLLQGFNLRKGETRQRRRKWRSIMENLKGTKIASYVEDGIETLECTLASSVPTNGNFPLCQTWLIDATC